MYLSGKKDKGNVQVLKNDGSEGAQRLPRHDKNGKPIEHKEYDYDRPPTEKERRQVGKNRGNRRVVIGSDGSVYYAGQYYRKFKRFYK